MAKVKIVVPVSSTTGWLYPGYTNNNNGILKADTDINILQLGYPNNPSYTLNNDIKLSAYWTTIPSYPGSGASRTAVGANNKLGFVAGSTTKMIKQVTFGMSIAGHIINHAITVTADLATGIVRIESIPNSIIDICAFELTAYVNT